MTTIKCAAVSPLGRLIGGICLGFCFLQCDSNLVWVPRPTESPGTTVPAGLGIELASLSATVQEDLTGADPLPDPLIKLSFRWKTPPQHWPKGYSMNPPTGSTPEMAFHLVEAPAPHPDSLPGPFRYPALPAPISPTLDPTRETFSLLFRLSTENGNAFQWNFPILTQLALPLQTPKGPLMLFSESFWIQAVSPIKSTQTVLMYFYDGDFATTHQIREKVIPHLFWNPGVGGMAGRTRFWFTLFEQSTGQRFLDQVPLSCSPKFFKGTQWCTASLDPEDTTSPFASIKDSGLFLLPQTSTQALHTGTIWNLIERQVTLTHPGRLTETTRKMKPPADPSDHFKVTLTASSLTPSSPFPAITTTQSVTQSLGIPYTFGETTVTETPPTPPPPRAAPPTPDKTIHTVTATAIQTIFFLIRAPAVGLKPNQPIPIALNTFTTAMDDLESILTDAFLKNIKNHPAVIKKVLPDSGDSRTIFPLPHKRAFFVRETQLRTKGGLRELEEDSFDLPIARQSQRFLHITDDKIHEKTGPEEKAASTNDLDLLPKRLERFLEHCKKPAGLDGMAFKMLDTFMRQYLIPQARNLAEKGSDTLLESSEPALQKLSGARLPESFHLVYVSDQDRFDLTNSTAEGMLRSMSTAFQSFADRVNKEGWQVSLHLHFLSTKGVSPGVPDTLKAFKSVHLEEPLAITQMRDPPSDYGFENIKILQSLQHSMPDPLKWWGRKAP